MDMPVQSIYIAKFVHFSSFGIPRPTPALMGVKFGMEESTKFCPSYGVKTPKSPLSNLNSGACMLAIITVYFSMSAK